MDTFSHVVSDVDVFFLLKPSVQNVTDAMVGTDFPAHASHPSNNDVTNEQFYNEMMAFFLEICLCASVKCEHIPIGLIVLHVER